MSDVPDPVENDELGWGFVAVLVASVLAAVTVLPWLAGKALWWLVEHEGWPRFYVAAAVAAAGAVYIVRQRRSR